MLLRPRLIFFATQLYPLAMGLPSGFGGAETEMWNVALGLAEDETYDVRALTLAGEMERPEKFGGLTLHPVPPAAPVSYKTGLLKRRQVILQYFSRLFRALTRQRGDIYFSKLASREASVAYFAAKAVRGKYVFRIEHDWETNLIDLTQKIFSGSRFAPKIFLYCLRRADLVIAQTQSQVDALAANYNINAIIIPNGHLMPPDDSIAHDPEQRKSVIWIGRAHPMKRPMLFLDLAERHPDFQFTMIMAPSAEHADLLAQTRSRAETLPNVQFFPGVSATEVNQHFQKARLFVLTSEAEGFSNVIIEAMKNGAPAVSLGHNPNNLLYPVTSSDVPPVSPGFYAAESMDTCSELIDLLFTNVDFWQRCHYKSIAFAKETFGLPIVLEKYRRHITQLLNKQ